MANGQVTNQDLINSFTQATGAGRVNPRLLIQMLRERAREAKLDDKQFAQNLKSTGNTAIFGNKALRDFALIKRKNPNITLREFFSNPDVMARYTVKGVDDIASGEASPVTLKEALTTGFGQITGRKANIPLTDAQKEQMIEDEDLINMEEMEALHDIVQGDSQAVLNDIEVQNLMNNPQATANLENYPVDEDNVNMQNAMGLYHRRDGRNYATGNLVSDEREAVKRYSDRARGKWRAPGESGDLPKQIIQSIDETASVEPSVVSEASSVLPSDFTRFGDTDYYQYGNLPKNSPSFVYDKGGNLGGILDSGGVEVIPVDDSIREMAKQVGQGNEFNYLQVGDKVGQEVGEKVGEEVGEQIGGAIEGLGDFVKPAKIGMSFAKEGLTPQNTLSSLGLASKALGFNPLIGGALGLASLFAGGNRRNYG